MENLLTGSEPEPRKRGRPSPINESTLRSNRSSLLGAFEYHWAEIGRELQRARTIAAVRKALQPITNHRSSVEVFLYKPTEKTSMKELRELRKATDGLSVALRKAIPEEREAAERLELVLGALKDNGPDDQLQRLCEKRRRQHADVSERVQELRSRLEASEHRTRRQEAYIAQLELLDFIGSKRYTLSPLNFANAMAGLPFIGWRQSATRCRRTKAGQYFHFQYEMFQEVAHALARPPKTAEQAIEQAKKYLLTSKRQSQLSIKQLRDEWYFFQVAIETAYENKTERTALPYKVFAEYQRRTSARSRFDQVMQEEERL